MMKKIRKTPIFSNYVLLWVLILLFIIGSISNPVFLTSGNFNTLITGRVTVGIIAVAMTICMAAGEMDISLGYMMGSCMMVGAYCGSTGMSSAGALAMCVVMGAIYGLLNGFLVVVVKIPSTIVTLGSGMIFYAISMTANDSKPITGVMSNETLTFFRTRIFGVLPCVWLLIILFIFGYWLLEHTPLGGQIYNVGFSKRVSHLAGIQTNFIKFFSFTICGAITGLAAMINLAQSGNASVSTGPSYLMPTLAVCFLSITTHKIGRYNMVGSVIALFTLGFAYNVANLAGAPFWFENIVNGIVLLGVVLMNGKDSRSAHSG